MMITLHKKDIRKALGVGLLVFELAISPRYTSVCACSITSVDVSLSLYNNILQQNQSDRPELKYNILVDSSNR